MKADENYEKAMAVYAEAMAADEKMKVSQTLCVAISERSEMFNDLLVDLNGMFAECSSLLTGVVRKKEGWIFKKKLTSKDFTEDELKLIAVTRSLAGAVKAVIDTPILSKDGNIAYEAENLYDETIKKLPEFDKVVDEVKSVDYHAKPIVAKSNNSSKQSTSTKPTTVLGAARNVLAVVLGIALATPIALNLTFFSTLFVEDSYTFLFVDSLLVNLVAFWLLSCTSITMIIGHFKHSKIEKIYGYGAGIALSILYVLYCKSVEQMEHYIIFSVIFFFVCAFLCAKLGERNWQSAKFLSAIAVMMAIWVFGFAIYVVFSIWLGFSSDFWLVATTILMSVMCIFGFEGCLKE